MKKLVIGLCVSMILLGLSACGTGNEDQRKNAAVESGEENTDVGSAGGKQSAGTAVTDADEKQGDGKAATGNETIVDTESGSNKMFALKEFIIGTIGQQNYYPDVTVEAEQLEEIFGIAPEMYDEYLAEVSQDGTNVDTLLIIKAKDDKVEAVQEALYAYREAKEKATLEDYRNIGKVKASRIETNGNFVSFVQLGGDTAAALEAGEDAVIEQCLQMNELVLEVIAQNVH